MVIHEDLSKSPKSIESHDKYAESQNRYRSGRSTTDNTYSLMACAQNTRVRKRQNALFIY